MYSPTFDRNKFTKIFFLYNDIKVTQLAIHILLYYFISEGKKIINSELIFKRHRFLNIIKASWVNIDNHSSTRYRKSTLL